jgi:hypothetical protein
MQPTVSTKIAKHVLIGTSSYSLFSVCNSTSIDAERVKALWQLYDANSDQSISGYRKSRSFFIADPVRLRV